MSPRRPAVLSLTLVVALLAVPAFAKKTKRPDTEDIINYRLGIEHSHWLVGPIYYMASPEERTAYLALTGDDEAVAFQDEFWKRRDPEPDIFGNPVRDLYERRADEADRRYREAAVIGRRTDRGALYVLYGEPELIFFDPGRTPAQPDLEVWVYPKRVEDGLTDERPQRRYYFAEQDGRTVLFTPRASRRIEIP